MTPDEAVRMDRAIEKIEAVAVALAAIMPRCSQHDGRLVKLETAVGGNGREGLMTRVDRIEQKALAVWTMAGGTIALVSAAAGAVASWLAK